MLLHAAAALLHVTMRADAMVAVRRQERLRQLREQAARPMFGKVGRIGREQFVSEVTEASRDCWVVVHLFQDKCAALPLMLHRLPCPALPQQRQSAFTLH